MEKEKMIKDQYYIVKYGTDEYIIKFDGDLEECLSRSILNEKSFHNSSGSFRFNSTCIAHREANEDEKLWLETCIKENKLVPRIKLISNIYEIY